MKRVCGFAVSHIVPHYYAASSRVALSICLSLCQSVTLVSPSKTAETIKLPFGFGTPVGPLNRVGLLHEVQMPRWEGVILREKQTTHCKVQRHSAVICANTAEPIEVPFWLWARKGPRHDVLHGGPDS